MKVKLTIGLFLLISALFVHCSNNPVTSDALSKKAAPADVIAELSKTFAIEFDQTIRIPEENLLITFQGVTESRCPAGAQCCWEGQGIAELLLVKSHARQAVAKPIVQPGVEPGSDEFLRLADDALGYRLFLLELNPYPDMDHPTGPHDYVAKVRIDKLP